MTNEPENPNAFPSDPVYPRHPGMTLRDWFAGQAMAAIIAKMPFQEFPEDFSPYEKSAIGAYDYADAMLRARLPAAASIWRTVMNDDSKAMEAALMVCPIACKVSCATCARKAQAAVRAYLAQLPNEGSVVISVEWLEAVLAYANPIGPMGDHVFAEIRAMLAAPPNPAST